MPELRISPRSPKGNANDSDRSVSSLSLRRLRYVVTRSVDDQPQAAQSTTLGELMNKPALKHLEEEVSELLVELIKHGRGDGSLNRIKKEAADVQALIELLDVPTKRLKAKRKKMEKNYVA